MLGLFIYTVYIFDSIGRLTHMSFAVLMGVGGAKDQSALLTVPL